MFKQIKNYLLYNYHRPSAKIFHFYALLKKIFYNNKTDFFSERILLLKLPPESMIYYNFLGRIFFLIRNFLFTIIKIRN